VQRIVVHRVGLNPPLSFASSCFSLSFSKSCAKTAFGTARQERVASNAREARHLTHHPHRQSLHKEPELPASLQMMPRFQEANVLLFRSVSWQIRDPCSSCIVAGFLLGAIVSVIGTVHVLGTYNYPVLSQLLSVVFNFFDIHIDVHIPEKTSHRAGQNSRSSK
jgi:hypothetical protein